MWKKIIFRDLDTKTGNKQLEEAGRTTEDVSKELSIVKMNRAFFVATTTGDQLKLPVYLLGGHRRNCGFIT